MNLTVQELIDMLRDNERIGYSPIRGMDSGVLGGDPNAVRIEGRYDLAAVVRKLNERARK